MKTCPECAAEAPDKAHVCRYCGHNFSINPLKLIAGIAAFLLAAYFAQDYSL